MEEELTEMVNKSQIEFQNLPFQIHNTKTHEIKLFWEYVNREFKRENLSYAPNLERKAFYTTWKRVVVKSFVEYLKNMRIRDQ